MLKTIHDGKLTYNVQNPAQTLTPTSSNPAPSQFSPSWSSPFYRQQRPCTSKHPSDPQATISPTSTQYTHELSTLIGSIPPDLALNKLKPAPSRFSPQAFLPHSIFVPP